jgi:hypothetical protein
VVGARVVTISSKGQRMPPKKVIKGTISWPKLLEYTWIAMPFHQFKHLILLAGALKLT